MAKKKSMRVSPDPRPATAPIQTRRPLEGAARQNVIDQIINELRNRFTFGTAQDDLSDLLGRLDGQSYQSEQLGSMTWADDPDLENVDY